MGHATPDSALPTLHHLVERLRAWRRRRDAARRLMLMSDAHLKDIGLHRSEVESRLFELDGCWRHQQRSSAATQDG
jgi:uncharacterized protein YjiS (DUF1127 family)